MENNRSKERAARYAVVYNKILQMIQEGMYPEGSKLVSEPLLAEQMNVSRSTLRQALALLQEDGIIEARRGVGNFVRKTMDAGATGLERMDNPLYKSLEEPVDQVELNVVPGISTRYTEQIFRRKMPVVLAVHRFYEREGTVQAYCFSHIATDFPELNQVDLNDRDAFLAFLEREIYQAAHSRKCELRVVRMTENLKEKSIKNESGLFQMILETILDKNGDVVAVNKFYIPIEKAVVRVFSSNA